ncbi:MAG: hypothetical protein ACXVP3_03785, partial [Actinomycetota bacterium]
MPDDDASPYRLPRTATPSRYQLEVDTDLSASAFSGAVDVTITVHQPTAEIVLNAAELAVGPAWITPAGGGRSDA